MNATPARYCHPCKADGLKVKAGLNRAGNAHNRRARVGEVMTNVCDMHGDALDVARATVSGKGIDARQQAEGAIFAEGAALAGRKGALVEARKDAMALIGKAHLRKMLNAANARGWTANHADSLFDAMIDAAIKRLGDRAFNGQALDVEFVINSTLRSEESGASERQRAKDTHLDRPMGGRGLNNPDATLGSILEAQGRVTDTTPASIGWVVGNTLTVGVTDLAGIIAGGRPDGLTDADWAYLVEAYAA